MKITYGRIAAASLVALAAAGIANTGTAQSQPAKGAKIENSYICVFNPGLVNKGQVKAEANRSANAAGGAVAQTYENTIRGFAVNASAQGVSKMQAKNPRIAFCEQDQTMAVVQKGKGKPGGSTPPPESTPWGVLRVGGGLSGSTATAWVIDTGIDYDHPDLNVDTARSASFTREKNGDDGNGHGTHVAGTIAAIKGNGIGVVGVSPGTKVVAIKVLTRSGSGSNSGVIAGVDYAAANFSNGDVANMSLGGGFSQALNDAVVAAAAKGLKFALAAGNESTSATTKSPASANGPNIYTISSFAQGDNWSSFSNYGNPPVDFAEPGSAIPSTYLNGGYATLSGTSMASPHAAGLLLLGAIRSGGSVKGDPDGNADTIGIN
ncbi:S8 family serine peptidase [Qipengyuania sp. XHP0207]|uniref:S8 family serine peptidase n=1 Tax=Qipengyuania sp. XHP0207 TaxID=3038078 RepID=UPI00241F35BB|nr:S8 family serine peptidase [Qipengyuania sp. XHP0207]MDG5748843.1 S8 family serine peptidase [Qipengyuania sp. XHP0207]